ncbi:MAG: c-type cytochrome domain-containing protein [Planctomycetaceae bacterium]
MRASGALVQVFQTRSGAAQPSRTTSVLTSLLLFSVCCCTHLAVAAPASAALPPETRKELTELQKQLKETTALLKKNEVEKVREILDSVEKRVTELAIPEDEKDRAWTTLKTALEKAKYAFPVSFEKEVAPIVKTNCIRCHSEAQASANLRLDTYAAIAKGGRSGPVVFPRVPNRSLLAVKLIHPDEKMRMPQGAAKLKDPEILTVVRWIEQGAGFDGEDRDAPIGDSLVEKKPPVQVAMADGSETVSFRKDIAPMMVNICIGCHSGNNARGDYRFETFEQLLQGGPTGNTIVPGKPDESYLIDLVLRQDPLKMPAGQAQLKLSQAKAFETWVREGAKFDGTDPKAPIRTLVPSDAELEAARLAAMSDADFEKRRIEQAEALWKRVAPRTTGASVTTPDFYLYGTVAEDRLKMLGDAAQAQVTALASKYPLPAGQKPFRGRLIIFVTKDRFDYEEFNTVLMNNRRTPKAISGHVVINANLETAWLAMHDLGDTPSDTALTAPELLNSLIAQAWVSRDGTALPEWLRQGFGTLEAGLPKDSPWLKALPARATKAMATVTDPATLFVDGTFAPDEASDVGYLLVRFLMNQGGKERFQIALDELKKNPNAPAALQQAYGAPTAQLGQLFIRTGL